MSEGNARGGDNGPVLRRGGRTRRHAGTVAAGLAVGLVRCCVAGGPPPPVTLSRCDTARDVAGWAEVERESGSVRREAVTSCEGVPAVRFTWTVRRTAPHDWLIVTHDFDPPAARAGGRYLQFDVQPGPGRCFANLKVVTTDGAFEDALTNIEPTVLPGRTTTVRLDLDQVGLRGDIRQVAFFMGAHWRGIETGVPYVLDVAALTLVPGTSQAYAPPRLEIRPEWSLFFADEPVRVRFADRSGEGAPRALALLADGTELARVQTASSGGWVAADFGQRPPGDYRVVIIPDGPGGAVRVRPRAEACMRYDWRAALQINGRMTFPCGLFFLEENAGDERLREAAAAGFNVFTRPLHEPAGARRVFDRARGAGGMMVFAGPYDNPGAKEDAAYWRDLFADPAVLTHPACGLWYLKDEPLLARADGLSTIADYIRQADPYHPTTVVLNSPLAFPRYAAFVDVLMGDVYPLPTRPIASVADFTDRLRQASDGSKPAIIVVQAFRDVGLVAPTPDLLRAMSYLAVAHGANGLVFYAYNHQGSQSREGAWRIPDSDPALWDAMKRLAGELRDLTGLFTGGDEGPAFDPGLPTAVHARVIDWSGRRYALFVNASAQAVPLQVRLPGCADGAVVESVFDGRRLAAPDAGGALPPHGVRLLCWSAGRVAGRGVSGAEKRK